MEFQKVFNSDIGDFDRPDLNNPELMGLRVRLINEELLEVIKAGLNEGRPELVKEICDLLYVLYGFGIAFGIPLRVLPNSFTHNMIYFSDVGFFTDLLNCNENLHKEIQDQQINGIQDPVALRLPLETMIRKCFIYTNQERIDLEKCFAEVHRSNMSKLGEDGRPIYREDGKILKGPFYTPCDLNPILNT